MVKLRCRSKILFSVSSGIVSTEGETFSRQKNSALPKIQIPCPRMENRLNSMWDVEILPGLRFWAA